MSRDEDIELRLADWLEDGPTGAPAAPIATALEHARTHPRRWSGVGRWRILMSGTNMTQVGPKLHTGWLYAAAAVVVLVVVVTAGYGLLQSNNSGVGTGPAPAPTDSLATTASPAATVISGTESCTTRTAATTSTVDGVKQSRGEQLDCSTTMSDPRLTGTGTATLNSDELSDGTWLGWGTREIRNTNGSWSGPFALTSTASATTMAFDAVLTGSGGYAELLFRGRVEMTTMTTTLTGVILPVGPTVSGTETCTFDQGNDREFTVGDITAYRGVVGRCTDTMSDVRLSGTGRIELSIDMRPDQSADIWGRYTLTNDGGTWEGLWAGTVDKGYTTHRVESLLVGTGLYEGLLYRMSVISDPTGSGYTLTGLIVPRS